MSSSACVDQDNETGPTERRPGDVGAAGGEFGYVLELAPGQQLQGKGGSIDDAVAPADGTAETRRSGLRYRITWSVEARPISGPSLPA